MNITDHLLVLAVMLLITVSLIISRKIWFRSLLIVVSLLLIIMGMIDRLNYLIFWNIVFLLINLLQLYKQANNRKINESIIDIYNNVFSALSKREFQKFWDQGTLLNSRRKEYLCKQDVTQGDIFLLLSGKCSVHRDDEKVCDLYRADFIAEKGYLFNAPASADVIAETDISYFAWNRKILQKMKENNEILFQKLEEILLSDKEK